MTQWIKNPPAIHRRCGDMSSIPGPGKMPWKRKWPPLLYSCLENPMDRGDWQATIHEVTKSQTWLSTWKNRSDCVEVRHLSWGYPPAPVRYPQPVGLASITHCWPAPLMSITITLQCWRPGFNSWVGKIPWRREWLSTPVFLPGEFCGQSQ